MAQRAVSELQTGLLLISFRDDRPFPASVPIPACAGDLLERKNKGNPEAGGESTAPSSWTGCGSVDASSHPKPGLGGEFGDVAAPAPEPLGRAATQVLCSRVGRGKWCLGEQGYCLAAGGGDSSPACASGTSLIFLERLLIYA